MARGCPYVLPMLPNARIAVLALLGALFGLAAMPSGAEAQTPEQPVVVELFTSQGCSSCPPADSVLAELSGRDDVIALALHVDYWDYLGWRDTFAQHEFTERQVAYRNAWRKSVVYTPQMVVHGHRDVLATRAGELEAAIKDAREAAPKVTLVIEREDGMLKCRIEPGPKPVGGIVWIAKYTRGVTVEVSRGENAGRMLSYANVVRSLHRIGHWSGAAAEEVAMPQPEPGEGVAVWLQAGEAGPILAAAKIENPDD